MRVSQRLKTKVLVYFVLLGVDAQTGTQEVSFGVRPRWTPGAQNGALEICFQKRKRFCVRELHQCFS